MFIQKIRSQRNSPPKVGNQVAILERPADADIATIVKLFSVQVPALDKLLKSLLWKRKLYIWWPFLLLKHLMKKSSQKQIRVSAANKYCSGARD